MYIGCFLLVRRQKGCSKKASLFFMGKMKVRDLISILDAIAPFETAQGWDNVGLMLGDPGREFSKLLVALDPCFEVISRAQEIGADCIVTHHPLFFQPIRSLNLEHATAQKVSLLMKSDICVICMHTNLDAARGGVADVLASRLGLHEIEDCGLMRTGTLPEKTALSRWAFSLPFENIRIVDAKRMVRRVGLCPGSGMDLWEDARARGCDTFVTGDVKYHDAMDAREAGLNVIDLGHFGAENIIVKPLVTKIQQQMPGVCIHAYEGRDVFTYTKERED